MSCSKLSGKLLQSFLELPRSHDKVMWPLAVPHFGVPQSSACSDLYSDGCCCSHVPFRSGCCLLIFVLHLQNDLFFAAGISPYPSQAASSLGHHSAPLGPCHLLGALPPSVGPLLLPHCQGHFFLVPRNLNPFCFSEILYSNLPNLPLTS